MTTSTMLFGTKKKKRKNSFRAPRFGAEYSAGNTVQMLKPEMGGTDRFVVESRLAVFFTLWNVSVLAEKINLEEL